MIYTKDVYTGPMQWGPNKSNFYIHIHQENIGRAENGNGRHIAAELTRQKKSALAASKNYYYSMTADVLSPESKILLEEAFANDNLSLYNMLDKTLTDAITKTISSNLLTELLKRQTDLSQQNIGQQIALRGKPAIIAFNSLLQTLAECAKLLGSHEGGQLAALLLSNQHSLDGDRFLAVSMGAKLNKALTNFIAKNNNITIEQKASIHVARKIQEFAKHMQATRKEKGKKMTESSVNNIVNKIIYSQGFAEALTGIINNTAYKAASSLTVDYTGDKMRKIHLTDSKGDSLGFDMTTAAREGKMDVRLNNFIFSMSGLSGIDKGQLMIDVGISTKSYVTQFFGDIENQKRQSFASGSGGTLKEALEAIFDNNVRPLYLSYNIFAHGSKRPKEVKALNDLILTRQLVRLFSSRGGSQDFSQFMIVNGKVVSIWQMILATEKFVGLSNSLGGAQQMVALTIPDRVKIENAEKASYSDRYSRVKAINSEINKTRIYAHLHIDKLSNL